MPWLKVDDGFEEHPKVRPLSDAAHRLWMRAAAWCRRTGSAGFVPREQLASISQNAAPLKRLLKLTDELVNARAGGVYKVGLWEPVEGGWKFHDWLEYQPEEPTPKPKLTRSEAAALAGRASAASRVATHGTAQPGRVERRSNVANNVRDSLGCRSPNIVRRTNLERPEPPIPIPKFRSLISGSKDLTGSQPFGGPVTAEQIDKALEEREANREKEQGKPEEPAESAELKATGTSHG